MNLLNLILIAVLLVFSAESSVVQIESKKIDVPGVGVVQLTREDVGEPIGAPERLTVVMKCKKGDKSTQVGLFRMCRLEKYEFDKGSKALRLTLLSGRVVHNSGEVICDQVDRKEIELARSCD